MVCSGAVAYVPRFELEAGVTEGVQTHPELLGVFEILKHSIVDS